ncbi:hypothetical protein SARC_09499 [Sphaeroforma arctica JP610]|uniref:ATP-grasp domain-containing protein n=1 Tax=Sphaeroforma arctica JP610 TaxID=667725 RepID=A0A0L0FPZ2_9EUKA|nr:hypothetical protein SARC_09499 [Sphaeroforma arctica JP610]KNC78053.1 hypothetical protein SARC_09499 [Sphaeroforma arctica JP610]|eukprot:XP_014151955.1 hypothetical protein SARC_09499 [Sphaeroforma arctica JP610]
MSSLSAAELEQLNANAADEATQALRFKALKGKRMLFISGSFMYPSMAGTLSDHCKALREYGVHITGVYHEARKGEGYHQQAEERSCHDRAILCDMDGEPARASESIVAAIKAAGLEGEFDGAYSPHESTQPMLGKVCELLGIFGNPFSAYEIARDKYATRKALEAAGLNTAQAVQIWTEKDIAKAAEKVGFPMIIKPTVGMGSAGVYKIQDEEELDTMVKRLLEDISSDWMLSQNQVGDQAPILAETFIVPTKFGGLVTEFDVDVQFWNGEMVYGNVLDNWEPEAPYFQDRGFHMPSITPPNVQQELIDYAAACVKAFGFKMGNFHMEAWYTEFGPVLIECNPRVGGGSVDKMHIEVFGASPAMGMTMAMMNVPINPPRFSEQQCSYGFLLVPAHKTGLLMEAKYLDEVLKHDLCEGGSYSKKAGDYCKGLDQSVPEWIGTVDFKTSKPVDVLIEAMVECMDIAVATAKKDTVIQRRNSHVLSVHVDEETQLLEASAEAALNAKGRPRRNSVLLDELPTENHMTQAELDQLMQNRPDEETQKLRFKALSGKRMLFISGSFMYPAMAATIGDLLIDMRNYGVHIVGVYQEDKKGEGYHQQAEERGCHDEAIFCDMTGEPAEAGKRISDAVTAANMKPFDGCYSPHESTQPIIGKVCETLKIFANPASSYDIARDKYATRKALEAAGLNTASAVQIWTEKDIAKAIEVVGFPMIIKPTVGMGSAGVYKIEDADMLDTMVKRLLADISSDWMLAQNQFGDQAPILAETCIIPIKFGGLVTEFDIDVQFWDGEMVYGNVIDNWEPEAPYFQDRGFHMPSFTPANVQQELIEYAAACVKAFGFKLGNFHMEAWYTENGPVLIECNPRVGGGSVSKMHEKVFGASPAVNMTLAMMGIPINPPRFTEPQCAYGFMLTPAHRTGILREADYLSEVLDHKLCDGGVYTKKVGDKIRGLDLYVPDWIAMVDFTSTGTVHHMVSEMEKLMAKASAACAAATIPERRRSRLMSDADMEV